MTVIEREEEEREKWESPAVPAPAVTVHQFAHNHCRRQFA
jgi:hypothetical protein